MDLSRLIQVARSRQPADLLLANARVVDLFTPAVVEADLLVAEGRIAGLRPRGTAPAAAEVIDLRGAYVAPGFIDAHVHIESSLLTPPQFAAAVVPRGVTTVIADPHEIANVLGVTGIRYMLQAARWNPLSIYIMAPSCVPAGPLESAGAELSALDLEGVLQDRWVLGLGEMMNVPGELAAARPRPVDGHAPGLAGPDLDAYTAAGIGSDHECTTVEEASEKLRRGLMVLIREATGARNLETLLPLVHPGNARRFAFATDDRTPLHLLDEGSIDGMVRTAIARGLDPLVALQLASLNAAEHYGLRDRGALGPGRLADLFVFDDLRAPQPRLVFRHGRLVAREGALLPYERPERPPAIRGSVNVPRHTLLFRVPARGRRLRVIDVIPDQITTGVAIVDARVVAGEVVADPARDVLKLAVIERHAGSGRVGIGFVRGFGLRLGALASSVAHDAHNIIVVGASDDAMRAAVDLVLEMQGGLAAVAGRETARLPLPIAGLMSDRPLAEVAAAQRRLLGLARRMGSRLADPFMTLSFMALSVVPALKLTDRGLVDVTRGEVVDAFVE